MIYVSMGIHYSTLRIDSTLWAILKKKAKLEGRSVNNLIVVYIKKGA